jgi:GTP cyclohydrolase I
MSKTTDIIVPEAVGVESIADLVRKMIVQLGEDPNREGLRHTPERFEKAMRFLTKGYAQDQDKILNGAMFSVCYDQMVLVKDIEVYSMCEHHLLPFFGKCHVAYIPDKKVVGLSKIARLVNMYARRLQIQERLTSQIAKAIAEKLSPQGVGVIIEARHLCMVMRGVEKQNSVATTSAMLGAFRENKQTRDEFLSLIRDAKP